MADQEKIFTPFVQLDTGPTRRVDGTGLGLSICKDVIELMGGTLRVSSEPGRGSRFWFDVYFPRAEPLAAMPAPAQRRAVTPHRILVVDDNVTNLHLLREILEQDGHAVSVAESGQAALDLLGGAGPAPEIIFLDYNLGDMDGMQVLQVYHFGVMNPAPVFFLTADMSPDTLARLRGSAARGVIGKPVRLTEIREVMVRVFAEGNAGENAQAGPKSLSGLRAVPVVYVDIEVLAEVAAISKRPEFLIEMLDRAILDIERTSTALLTALDGEQWDEVRKLAHALKGVAQQMGAFKLKNLAMSIMQLDIAGLEAARRKLGAELADLSANSVAALLEARAMPRPNADGEWVA